MSQPEDLSLNDSELRSLDAQAGVLDKRLEIVDGTMRWTDDGITFVARYTFETSKWDYRVIHGGAPITKRIVSTKSPEESDPRVRDSEMKKSFSRIDGFDAKSAFNILDAFGMYLVQNEGVIEGYFKTLIAPEEEEVVNNDIEAAALEIMRNGDPVGQIMGEFGQHHIGDDAYGRLLMLAIASQHVLNTRGLHLMPSGESGKGKSHAGLSMLHLLPRKYWLKASLSPKSLYYIDIKPGTVIFSDDVLIGEELLSIIRRCITGFTERQEHFTVDANRNGATLEIPERVVWIIASVDNALDSQTRNRMLDIAVDETTETDEAVYKKQVVDAITGEDEFPETDGVALCREIFRIIKELEPVRVTIPFADDIVWRHKGNRRNFDTFKDIIKAFAVIRHLQRETDESGGMVATLKDFHDAKKIYQSKAEGEMTKLTAGELDVIRTLHEHGECTIKSLQLILGVNRTTIIRRLKGRDGQSGLLEKVAGLTVEDRTVKIGDSHVRMEFYSLLKFDILSAWGNVVGLKGEKDV